MLASIHVVLLLLVPSPLTTTAFAQGGDTLRTGGKQKDERDSPLHACDDKTHEIRILEIRSTGRIEEDLALVDGVNVNRDVLIVACRNVIWPKFLALKPEGKGVLVQVRAWHKPADAGWREIRLNEPTLAQAIDENPSQDPARWDVREVRLVVNSTTVDDPTLIVPLRREAVKPTDLVRIRVRIGREADIKSADDTKAGPAVSENEDVIDTIYEVGRFGLHVRFSDMALFVQRLGEDRANSTGTNPVLFDSVNFRPAPGVNYGFNYYHRRHASIRLLEPGFGVHIVFLNWNERLRNAPSADTDLTQVTNLQVGMGLTGSMFDGTVVGALGWNLHVKDQRPYLGVGFSITGLARKIAQFVRE